MDHQDNLPQEMPAQQPIPSIANEACSATTVPSQMQNNTENAEKSYTFRWSYEDQQAFDLKNKKKKKRQGPMTFAIVMAIAFFVCIALLVGVLVWNELKEDPTQPNGTPNGSSIADVAEAVIPSTVLIEAIGEGSGGYGTGFFVSADGYIATNYHVIEGAETVRVTLSAGQVKDARIVGYAQADDIAVLKISGDNYPALSIGDSDALRVGDILVAVGHPGGVEAPWTTTHGIVSALNRVITVNTDIEIFDVTMIQTDAALNPGNSGGPICNLNGEVVGIVSRKLTDTEGISLALPINGSMELINAIIRDGHAENVVSSISRSRPVMGISGYDIRKGESYTYNNATYTATADGVMISAVTASSGAYGVLKPADILIGLDDYTFTTMEELKYILYEYSVGDRVTVTVVRDGKVRELSIVLGLIE